MSMSFKNTTFYKQFGNNAEEWKVVTFEGKVYIGDGWKEEYEDSNYKEATLYVADSRIEISRKNSKTIVNTKFK